MESKKIIKRLLFIFGGFVIATLAVLTILVSVYEKSIGQKIITEVNKQLKSELSVEKFDLSIIRTFPSLGANLQEVLLKDNKGNILLETNEISFRLSLFSLFGDHIKVKSVVISDGTLAIKIDRKGRGNYAIFKESEAKGKTATASEGSLGIKLTSARLRNIQLIYDDKSTKQNIRLTVNNATFSGLFSSDRFSLKSEATIKSHFIEMEGSRFLSEKEISYDALINVDFKKGKYTFEDLKIGIESNIFKAKGSIEERKNNTTYYDILFEGEEASLASMLDILPATYLESLGDLKSKGDFIVKAQIKGESNTQKTPRIKANFTLKNGKISSTRMDGALKDVTFAAKFDNGKKHANKTSIFEINSFKAYFKRELLEFDFKVSNLDNPVIDFTMNGVIPLKMVHGMMQDSRISGGSGEIEIADLHLKGRYKDMLNVSRISKVKLGGLIEFDDASLTINDEKMILDRGRLKLDNNTLTIEDLKLEGGGSEINLSGEAHNIIPVLFADSLNSKRAALVFAIDLFSPVLDMDRLANLSLASEEEAEDMGVAVDSLAESRILKREKITNFLKGTFDAQIDEFNYNKIEGTDFKGKLSFDKNELKIDGDVLTMGGRMQLDAKLFFEDKPWLKTKIICEKIDLSEFLRQSENFSQEVMTDKNISGKMDAKMVLYVYWDEEGNFLDDKLRILVGAGIADGEIVDFEMLESFSAMVKVKDLKHIKFTNMENYFEVRKGRLIIPVMFIQSNAMNLTISGEHSFENEIKYNLKVNAGQVLVNRFKRHNAKLSPQKASRSGFFNLYYTILGTLDQINYKSAKRQVKEDFKLSQLHKEDIQAELEKEFGLIDLVEAPADWRDFGGAPQYGTPLNPDAKQVNHKKQTPNAPSKDKSEGENDGEFLDWEIEGGEDDQ